MGFNSGFKGLKRILLI